MHRYSSLRVWRQSAIVIPVLLALAGCFGEGDGKQSIPGTPPPPDTGVLVDALVEGVSWETSGGLTGTTNNLGEFQYRSGDTVTFSIGGIVLGTVSGAPFVTPVELTGSLDPTQQPALNQLVFVQSIDADSDPENGITVSAATSSAAAGLTLDFTAADFPTQVAAVVAAIAPGNAVVSETDALFHFYRTYVSFGGTDTFAFLMPGFAPAGNGVAYEVVFNDEFESGTAPSPDKWTIETGYGPNDDGWGNNEWQLYTESSDNVRVEEGNLVLEARCPTPPCGVRDGTITSGKINTLDKFNFRYGTVIARIKPPVGDGAWPAFWSLGANHPDIGWPRSGEIDFMEMHNAFSDERTTHFTMHWCDDSIQAPDDCSFPDGWVFFTDNLTFNESLGDDFHIFEADWNENRIIGKIDGIPYFTRTIEPDTMEEFLREFYMILNVAMGGTLGSDNQPPNGNETWPQTMLVDYVRVFQRTGGPAQNLVIDFEDAPETYDFGPSGGFGGGAAGVIANPAMESINTSAQVGRMLKFAGDVFGGSTLALSNPVELPGGGDVTMKVWSPRPVNVLFKIEGPVESEVEVAHGGSGWEELTFGFSTFSGTVEGITLIFDLGIVGDAEGDPDNWTFYFDDIELPTTGAGGGDDGGDSPGGVIADFEDAPETYNFGVDGGFGGGAAAVIANPVPEGINTSAQVGRMLKFAGEVFAGSTLTLPEALNVPSGSSFTMKVWSPRVVNVLFKLEGPVEAEVELTHGGTGWELMTFDFPTFSGTVEGITLIFDNGTVGDAMGDPDNWTFYFDDITLIVPDDDGGDDGGDDGTPGVIADFENAPETYDFGPDGGFGGGAAAVIANPVPEGINTSAQVGRMLKFAGEVFAGSTLMLPSPINVTEGSSFTMKVWSPRVVNVLFKLEGPVEAEVELTHGGTGWELMTFDFPTFSGSVEGITLIFDNGTAGDAMGDPDNWTFYFDDITLVAPDDGGGDNGGDDGMPVVIADFENAPETYDFGVDGGFGGGAAAVIANPVPEGINTSAQVGRMLKFAGEVFGGSTLMLPAPLDVTAGSSFTMKVWSPRAVNVLFKLEGPVEAEVELTHAGTGWELMTFDFPTFAGSVEGITLIFDLGTIGDAEGDPDNWTFYFDDITLVPPGGGGDDGGGDDGMAVLIADFESAPETYDFGVDGGFGGGAAAVIANPVPEGINTSAQVGRMLKFAGEVFGGSTLMLPAPLDVTAGSSFTMKVWSPRAVNVLFKLEGPVEAEVELAHGGTGWELMTFDFPTFAGSVEGITLIFDLGIIGDAEGDPDNWTFYFDDITLVPPGGGGDDGGGDDGSTSLVADFEGDPNSYDFGAEGGFGGGAAAVIDNPVPEGINTSAQVGRMLKFAGEVFGGSTLMLPAPLDVSSGSSFTIKVWSPRAVNVLFKLEGPVESEVELTHGGTGWEELSFDFSTFSGSVEGITLIFDLGTIGAAGTDPDNWTFYFDDITLVGPGGGGGAPSSLADFEGDPNSYDFGVEGGFGGGAAAVIDNPVPEGINTSAQVARMLKFAGEVFGGSTLMLDTPINVTSGSSFTMKVWSPRVVDVLFKLEGPTVAEVELTHGGTGWEEMTFDFPTFAGSVEGLTWIFDLGVIGAAGTDPDNWTFYFDDITLVAPAR